MIREAVSFGLNSMPRNRTSDTSSPAKPRCKRSRRKRRDRERFDVLVERRMVMLEGFVMGQVTRSGPIEHRANQAGKGTTDTARRLDVFRRGLGLPGHHHQPQAFHVHADRDHVRGEQHIQRLLGNVLVILLLERFFTLGGSSSGSNPASSRSRICGMSSERIRLVNSAR